jgi:hypothetical protein
LPADLGEREPLDDLHETHGLCPRHLAHFLAEARSQPLAGLRFLIVIKLGDQSLYDHLIRAMAGVDGVHIMVDRRNRERRREAHHMPGDRRHANRRQPRGLIHSIGCTFVRFPQAQGAAAAG